MIGGKWGFCQMGLTPLRERQDETNDCHRKLYPYSMYQTNKKMLSWVMCWLQDHMVGDGSVMVGIWGVVGWGEWMGGWSGRSLASVHCASIYSMCAFQSRDGWGRGLPEVDLGNPAGD